MNIQDPIADMLTRIRNSQVAKKDIVYIPLSKIKKEIACILKKEGFIKSFEVTEIFKNIHERYLKIMAPLIFLLK